MSMVEMLRGAMSPPKKAVATLDAAKPAGNAGWSEAEDFTQRDIAMQAAAAIQQWAESDDMDEGETSADRLIALMVGIADANKDGGITEDEQSVLDVALEAAWEYLSELGATEEDVNALLNDWDVDAADRLKELVASALSGDESNADIDRFVFGEEDQEPALDSAAYRMKFAVRNGKKMRIKKRISGTVRLSAKQKLGIRKMLMKSHSAGARMRRMKSMRARVRMGM